MTLERARHFTIHRIILFDMLLNWILGVVLLASPGTVDALLAPGALFPPLVYQVIGLAFLLFAAWQAWIVRRGDIAAPGLIFAALMAVAPAILLTSALLFGDLPLYMLARVALWIGTVYMLLLGAWYLAYAWRLEKEAPAASDLRVFP